MARQPVLQPNGKLAIYGTIVDNFVALDCTVDQAIASLVTWYGPEHAVDLERVVKLCADGQLVFEWWKDWPDRLAWAKFLHGKDDEMVRKAWYRTPDMMARRYIDQFVAACQAESRTDEAIIELTVARQRITELEAQLAAMTTRAETAEARPGVTWIATRDQLPPPELRVLAVHNDGRMTMILRALYIPRFTVVEDYDADIESDYDPDSQLGYYPEGWYEAVENDGYAFIGPLTGTVTHWAKLPKLPQEVQP